jgi:hypothetical protein
MFKNHSFRYLFSESEDLLRDVVVEPDVPIPVVPVAAPVFDVDAPEL